MFYPIFGHAMFPGKVKESLPRLVKDTENPLLPLLMIGCLIGWREGFLEVVQDIIEDSPQLVVDLVQCETFMSELGHVLMNLGRSGDDVTESVSEVVYLLLYV